MKILLGFPVGDGQTGVFIKNAFESLGHEVLVLDVLVSRNELVECSKTFGPDLVFIAREEFLTPQIKEIRKEQPNVKTVCYNVDARHSAKEFGGGLLRLFDSVHIFYSKSRGMLAEYAALCPNTKVKYMMEGIDPAIHRKVDMTDEELNAYSVDVLFIGTKHPIYKTPYPYGRIGTMEYLAGQPDFKLELIGYDPPGHGQVFGDEHNKLCQAAKINIGHCGWGDVELANSARDFRICAAGGFLLTEHVKGIEELFEIGKECETYRTPQECAEKIRYYLEHEDERRQIANAGYLRTQQDHKFSDRLAKVIEDIKII